MRTVSGLRSSFLCLLVLGGWVGSPAAQAQVFIVDEQSGPGSNFTDLPQAVATVPDGAALIVRPGSYTAFTLTGKGLAIVGEDKDLVRIEKFVPGGTFSMLLEATTAAQTILIKNLTVSTVSTWVRNSQGPVIFDNVNTSSGLFPLTGGVLVDQSANVQFHRCDIVARIGTALKATDSVLQLSYTTLRHASGAVAGGSGGDALELTRTRCVAFASTIAGDDGMLGCCGSHCFLPGSPGGDGVLALDNSTFFSHGCTVTGGTGGNTNEVGWACGGGPLPGGAGVRLIGGSNAVFEGEPPVGGAGYQSVGPAGLPFVLMSGSTIQNIPGSVPSSGEIQGDMERGKTIQFTLQAKAGSVAILVIASDGTLAPLEPLANGAFLSSFRATIGPGIVPATGLAQVPFNIPARFPLAGVFHGQFVTLEFGPNVIRVSNTFALNVNS